MTTNKSILTVFLLPKICEIHFFLLKKYLEREKIYQLQIVRVLQKFVV